MVDDFEAKIKSGNDSAPDGVPDIKPASGAEPALHPALQIMREYVAGQAALGYATFDPGPRGDDVILVSYPKSGSTWFSYLLHQLRSGGSDDFTDIKNEVVDVTPGHWNPAENPFLLPHRFHPRAFKTHGRYDLAPKGGKFIYVSRNPQDVLLSLYHFIHDLFDIETRAPIEGFYQHYFLDRFATAHDISNIWDHILSWHPHRGDENVLWLHYEDLLEDLPQCLERIAGFIGVRLDPETFVRVLDHSRMDHMRQIATQLNPSQDNRTGKVTLGFGPHMQRYSRNLKFGKMRKGIRGGGVKALPEAILADLDRQWQSRITPQLGYRDYEDMSGQCSLLKPAGNQQDIS